MQLVKVQEPLELRWRGVPLFKTLVSHPLMADLCRGWHRGVASRS